MFIDRIMELNLLESRYKSGKAELIFIYGRRRIGKTRLIKEFLKGKRSIYLLARQTSLKENLMTFSRRIGESLGDDMLLLSPLQNWDAFFHYLSNNSKERLVVAIDEFPYLVELDPSLPSILQSFWDELLFSTKIFLLLLGSTVSAMEGLMGSKSPLYGRRTGQILLNPMDYFNARLFFPRYCTEDAVRSYSILGGTPAYLKLFSDDMKLEDNLKAQLRMDSLLYSDANFLLREELREPRYYMAILEAVASGYNRFGQIADVTGLSRSSLGKYLAVLEDLGFIERIVPLAKRRRPRKGIYRVADPYLRFWFRFIYPNQDLIEFGEIDELVSIIMRDLESYVGVIFEDIAAQLLRKMNSMRLLPFRFNKLGKWWEKDKEFDLVALSSKKALLVEVKWSDLNERDVERILAKMEEKVRGTPFESMDVSFLVIARRLKGQGGISFEEWDSHFLKEATSSVRKGNKDNRKES